MSICHIHGEIDEGIVLGFDDYYFSNSDIIPEHIKYEKYYLRILENTNNSYADWIKEIDNEVTVDVFGHSLSPADGDILRRILTLKNALINVYCKDEDFKAELIKNAAIILTPEKLIELTNGSDARLQFISLKDEGNNNIIKG